MKYFAVKTKSAIGMTVKSKKQMALLGGAGAIIAAILRDKSSALYAATIAAYNVAKTTGQTNAEDLRQWMSGSIMKALAAKRNVVFSFAVTVSETFRLNNPWVDGGAGVDVPITEDSLVRFWMQLANNAIEFTVDGKVGIARNGDNFRQVANSDYNTLGLEVDAESNYVTMGGKYVKNTAGSYMTGVSGITPGDAFITTDVAPEP
ncbi:MAG: hypothetical protein IIY78_05100 [Clostridia bacterium]|nr:hypothetical protein [Clostridia bacterium]